ncbi:phasin family protein [Schlesneria sp.]|uniref:phasin family protein n=1 Tax=Schlesneria sp. TaxID=2762018 RepID=UPI002F154386
MFDTLKQAVFASIGLADLTREKVEGVVAEVARRAKLSEADAAEFQAELNERVEKARAELGAEIDRRIDQAFIQLGLLKANVKHEAESVGSTVQKLTDQSLDTVLSRAGVARQEDIDSLTQRIELLEKKLAEKCS